MMGDDVFYEHMYAMKAKVDRRDRRIKELTKRLHDKNDSVTKLQERNGILRSVLDMKTRALTDFEVERTKFQEQIDMLVQDREAMQKASRQWYEKYKDAEEWRIFWKKGYFEVYAELQDQTKSEQPNWRARYWKVVGKLAARRDECRDLARENRELMAQLSGILVKNIDISKTEKVIEDLVDECRKLREDLGVKKDRIAFLEELAGSLYGEGWSDLSIFGAQNHRSGNIYKFGMLRNHIKALGGMVVGNDEGRDYWFEQYQRVAEENQALEERLKASQ